MLSGRRSFRRLRTGSGTSDRRPAVASSTLLLTVAVCACTEPESPASSPSAGIPPDPDALWIAVTSRSGGPAVDASATLVPIARFLHGTWDNAPWAGLLTLGGPGGGFEAVKTGDGVWSWPDASRYWDHPGRVADTLGRQPEVIATGVPRSWLLYSPAERGIALSTTGLVVTRAHCLHRWAIRTARDEGSAGAAGDGRGQPGIAFTKRPAAVMSEDDVPGLDRIRRNLGFADVAEGRKGDRSFHWLGLFRFNDGATTDAAAPAAADGAQLDASAENRLPGVVLGVLWGLYYESADYTVIRIDGDRSRVIMNASEGGC